MQSIYSFTRIYFYLTTLSMARLIASLQGGGAARNLLTGFKLKPFQYVSTHRPEVVGIYNETAMAPQIVVKVFPL
jgi:hypothetical protein